ncbi:MAG: hypothetical protein FJ288_19415 [Planctomycetes bacterium]|nr:hypothetical protein [Planctomycetota bacterium]
MLDANCPACGKPLTTPRLSPSDELRHPASPETVRLCFLCVGRVLVQATLAIHGEPAPRPESHRCPGHEERMAAHAKRIRWMLRKLKWAGVRA